MTYDIWKETGLTFCPEFESLTWIFLSYFMSFLPSDSENRKKSDPSLDCMMLILKPCIYPYKSYLCWLEPNWCEWNLEEQTDRVGFNNSWIPSLKYVISSHIDWSWFPTSLETGTQKLVPKVCGSTYLYVITKVIQNILLVIFFLTLKFFKTIEN